MGHQPNSVFRRFAQMDDFAEAPDLRTEPFHAEIGFRNYPTRHTLYFEFGGDVPADSVDADLEGTNYHDPLRAPESEWFPMAGAALNFTPNQAHHFESPIARGVRPRIHAVNGGTNPTIVPVYAGQTG